jgi:hypothetical protein
MQLHIERLDMMACAEVFRRTQSKMAAAAILDTAAILDLK